MNKNKPSMKLLTSIALTATLAATSASAAPVVMPDAPQIAAKGFVLMDYNSGKVLAEKRDEHSTSPG